MAGGLLNGTSVGLFLGVVLGFASFVVGVILCASDAIPAGIVTAIMGLPIIYLAGNNFFSRFITAEPNEWILLIENGVCLKAGVGMQIFQQIGQVVVKFPSAIHKVEFRAEQVTKEMAGVQVKGFAIWSINREADGPSKAYKYLDGLTPEGKKKADSNMAQMAEAIIRHQIANMAIQEVITEREKIRNKAKEDMVTVAAGWGIWIETVEITDVRISSSELFSNLQCEFRQKNRLEAQQIKLETEKQISEKRTAMNLETAKKESEARREREIYQSQQRLQTEKEQEQIEMKMQEIRQEKLLRDKEMERFRLDEERKLQQHRTKIELEKQRDHVEVEKRKAELKLLQIQNNVEAEKKKEAVALLKIQNDLEAQKKRDAVEVQKLNQKEVLNNERMKMAINKAKRDDDLAKQTLLMRQDRNDLEQKRLLQREAAKAKQTDALFVDRMKSQQVMSETNMRFATLESMQKIYGNLPIDTIKSVNINQGHSSDPTGMLTGLMTVMDNARGKVNAADVI